MSDRIPVPEEALRFLARKQIVATEEWDDLQWGEHSHAFTVAHSVGAGVVDEIFGLLTVAQEEGRSFKDFKKDLRKLMDDKDWHGRKGIGPDRKYISFRTRAIFHTNMRTAYEAGRCRQQVRGARLRPVWKYVSKLVGKNRRQEHIALHDKAFRYDDPFWDTNRPPNGWGCECTVISLSAHEAEQEGVDVLSSDAGGNPPELANPDGTDVDWKKFAPAEWRYNPALEALAPNFSKLNYLREAKTPDGKSVLKQVVERYREDMGGTRLTQGEFLALLRRMDKKDYVYQMVQYQVGNVGAMWQAAAGWGDSKIMATDKALYHGTADKVSGQKIPSEKFGELYRTMQQPEKVYENTRPDHPGQGKEFHLLSDAGGGEYLLVVVKYAEKAGTSPQVKTLGRVKREGYKNNRYKEIRK